MTMDYYIQTSSQAETVNETVVVQLQLQALEHHSNWYIYVHRSTKMQNTQGQRSSSYLTLSLVLSRYPR